MDTKIPPRELTDLEVLVEADSRLRWVRRLIAQAVRELLRDRKDVSNELAALLVAEEAALNAMKEASK